ncbi:MAG: bifunctional hydroxymethylpyrimidine kinase/phosphomethylpyrimidine kinase [Euryarchaeota archaeon]|nr:bifunctional hydroxymethylpyrimidine kinase/phosphomethylpyrimidine kinase [Euryarchaeota archaeon]
MIAMTIAGFDPSGGAGVLNDIKTFAALGVYGVGVVTALTAQNIKKVEDIDPVDAEFVKKQIDVVLEEEQIEYAKTGMLYSDEIIRAVASKASEYDLKLVVDPVLVAGSGGFLSKKDVRKSIIKHLLPIAKLTTPNILEAQVLSGIEIENEEDAIKAALKIGKICNVVVTGGHLGGTEVLYNGTLKIIEGELIKSENTHGSGCTYSSAIVAGLVKGHELERAIKDAGEFVRDSIKHGGRGTLNQFWKFKTV